MHTQYSLKKKKKKESAIDKWAGYWDNKIKTYLGLWERTERADGYIPPSLSLLCAAIRHTTSSSLQR